MRLVLPLLLFVAGCESWMQSEADGLFLLCNAETECDCASVTDGWREQCLAACIDNGVRNGQARRVLTDLPALGPEERKTRVRTAATAAGLDSCPFADSF